MGAAPKRYASGLEALKKVDLDIRRGEIFALLGPNGAGKTTLIGIICGTVNPTEGTVLADGHDIVKDYRAARAKIGLVPQELSTDMFETVWATVSFSRGLFGKPKNPALIEKVLRDLSLWDKRESKIMTLSGGMKRRVLIAKALSHEPTILFLDEPTAGVDVELRRDMWKMIRALRETGVTIILTTHYIEEAEEMADRVGVINKGGAGPGGGQGHAHGQAGQEAADHLPRSAADGGARAAGRLPPGAGRSPARLHLRRPVERPRAASWSGRSRRRLPRPRDARELAGGHLRQPGALVNVHAIKAIYFFEMARTFRTILQSILTPVISTSLYFIVFGSAIGSRMTDIDGVRYAAFIIPGLTMLSLLSESISNASFGIYMPRFAGTIYEVLSAPISYVEIVCGYVGAAATKSIMLGTIILVTARVFVPYQIAHPVWMIAFLVLTSVTFSMFGFIIGLWADGFEKLQLVPMLIVTPLTFLGGSFYSMKMLPPFWQKVTLFNPVVYLVSAFRWSFFGVSDVSVEISVGMTGLFLLVCLMIVRWMLKTGYRLKS
jgi:ABC-2 type transport system permease protein